MMPEPLVGWQDGDTTRSTLDIIQTCAATIFACTWSIQHLNVPAAHDSEARKFFRACKWMAVTVLLPEFILAHAIFELAMAIDCMHRMEMNTEGLHVDVKYPAWLMALRNSPARWSAMRRKLKPKAKPRVDGLDREEQQQSGSSSASQHSSPPEMVWTLTHAYFANMGGFAYQRPEYWPSPSEESSETPSLHPLPGPQLAHYLHWFDYPGITEESIKDKSKTDGFAKAFSVLQISQLVLSLIVRRVQSLPSSQIEILTLAFAVCGVVTYAIYWYKPKDVSIPIQLEFRSRTVPSSPFTPSGAGTIRSFQTFRSFDSFWKVATNGLAHQASLDRVPNDNIPIQSTVSTKHSATVLLALVSVAFGSLHAIAWNFDFPTPTEATLWHVCTILTITLPPLGLLAIPLSQATWRSGNPRDFLHATARVAREVAWQLDDVYEKRAAHAASLELEQIFNGVAEAGGLGARRLYKDVLWPGDKTVYGPGLRQKMLDCVDRKGPWRDRPDLDLPPSYRQHLEQLFRLMDGHGSKKMVEGAARTNVHPRRSVPAAWNAGLVYTTMGLYCVARLILVAIGLSSMRAMPEGVYAATWAELIPSI